MSSWKICVSDLLIKSSTKEITSTRLVHKTNKRISTLLFSKQSSFGFIWFQFETLQLKLSNWKFQILKSFLIETENGVSKRNVLYGVRAQNFTLWNFGPASTCSSLRSPHWGVLRIGEHFKFKKASQTFVSIWIKFVWFSRAPLSETFACSRDLLSETKCRDSRE